MQGGLGSQSQLERGVFGTVVIAEEVKMKL